MDYLEFYGLTEEPFSQAQNLKFYFNSAQHSRAMLRLMYAVDTMKGLAVLLGEIGTGKTILARRMLDNLPEAEYESALLVIIHSQITADWLLTRIARQLGIENPPPEKLKLLNQLYNRLIELHDKGKKAVVLVDEAQMLRSKDIMEEFRGLLNLEMDGKLITFVFFGLPELEEHLHLDEPLAQRIAVKCRLESFNRESTEGYISHRLRVSGAKSQLFIPKAIDLIHIYSRGIPRLINVICDNCLFEGYLLKQKTIDENLVKVIATDLGLAMKKNEKKLRIAPQPAASAQPVEEPGESTEAELESAISKAVKSKPEGEETEELDNVLNNIIETGDKPKTAKPEQKPTPSPDKNTEEDIDKIIDTLDEK
jgi:type II secretory pathway predicted ATPase ExeA